ncbi:putative protein DGCR14 [Paratrimastix pyriformis]|uniref:Uncharacterized protein n=1 Tax=Paratrimastix pyriformis TaxID=342808 RepID=A0ABQ8UBF7_9EUKA|nr:putative protein DGCR14 [Paratrimastix pyriformis]
MASQQKFPSREVLEEDEYIAQLRKIIQRDYFPDIPKLTTRLELFEALDSNNQDPPDQLPPNMTLDRFLETHTSEDDHSFAEVLSRMQDNHHEKFAWSFREGGPAPKMLPASVTGETDLKLLTAAPSTSTGASSTTSSPTPDPQPSPSPQNLKIGKTEFWPTNPRNAMMFTPPEVLRPVSADSVVMGPPKAISRANTRFRVHPQTPAGAPTQTLSPEELELQARVGRARNADIDELLRTPGGGAQVGGYGFVATPSPAPGNRVSDGGSPFYTWGTIAGTPVELPETPLDMSGGPRFHVPPTPAREETAFALAERAKKRAVASLHGQTNPLQTLAQRLTPRVSTPRTPSRTPTRVPAGSAPLATLVALSPAGRRLALRTNTPLRHQVVDLVKKAQHRKSQNGTAPATPTPGRTPATPVATPRAGR